MRLKKNPMQHDQESRTVSLLRDQVRRLRGLLEFIEDSKIFYDPDSPSSYDSAYVLHQAPITSSAKKPSWEVGMPRNTREDMSIVGNVFDCQFARRDHDESRMMSGILRSEGIEKSESEEPLQSIPFPCFWVRARQKSRRQISLMSMTNHAAGIGT